MVKKLTNITARIEKNSKAVEEKYSYDYFHKFSPVQLYNYLSPICNIDALRFLQMLIKRAQKGNNILTMKTYKRRYGKKVLPKVMRVLIDEGFIIEPIPTVYSCTAKINEYSSILSMMRIEDDAPDVIDTEENNAYRIVSEPGIVYRIISKRGKVLETFSDEKDASAYFEELIFPKDKRKKVIKISKEEEKELII